MRRATGLFTLAKQLMKTFRFPLQRVLEWRALQMRTEEEKLAASAAEAGGAGPSRERVARGGARRPRWGCSKLPAIGGSDLQALAAFQVRMRNERAALQASGTKCQAEIAEQRKRLLKARKDFRVLEKLKEKRFKAWIYLSDREIENTCRGSLHLALGSQWK